MRNSERNVFSMRKKLLKRNQKIARGFLHEYWDGKLFKKREHFLAQLGEPIVYPSTQRLSVHHFLRSSSLKSLGQSIANVMWSIIGKGD